MPPEDAGPAVADPAQPPVFAPAASHQVFEIPWSDEPADLSDPLSVLFGEATAEQQRVAQEAKEAAEQGSETTPPAPASASPVTPPKPDQSTTDLPTERAHGDVTSEVGDRESTGLTDEEVEKLARDPKFVARAERLAANRAGIILKQEREAAKQWDEAQAAFDTIEALRASQDPQELAEYATLMANPEVVGWVSRFNDAKAKREIAAAQPEGVEGRDALLAEFNEGAAREFAGMLQKTPWYSELPTGFRTRIEGAQQANPEVTWLEEWIGDYVAETEKYWKKQVSQAAQAARHDAAASSAPANPPRVPAAGQSSELSPDEIMNRHAFFGHDASAGVTPEQLAWAKEQKGFDY